MRYNLFISIVWCRPVSHPIDAKRHHRLAAFPIPTHPRADTSVEYYVVLAATYTGTAVLLYVVPYNVLYTVARSSLPKNMPHALRHIGTRAMPLMYAQGSGYGHCCGAE